VNVVAGALFDISFIAAAISLTTPILLVALGAVVSERAGVLNVGTEGMMLAGAFMAMVFAVQFGNAWAGVVGSLVIGTFSGLLLAFFAVTLAANQIVVGLALNFLALGGTTFFFQHYYPEQGGTILRTGDFHEWALPLLHRIPKIGSIFVQSPLVFLAFGLVPILGFILFRTAPGLVLRSVGENANAADTAGIPVLKVRYVAAIIGGALAGLGGGYLALVEAHAFQPNMSAGRGFMALAVVIVGRWRPGRALMAALVFGIANALVFRAQGLVPEIPPLTWTLLPYVLTLLVLIGLVGKVVAPADDGRPYVKEAV
jgi:ABC-type uncharacterized transport system permease subunit